MAKMMRMLAVAGVGAAAVSMMNSQNRSKVANVAKSMFKGKQEMMADMTGMKDMTDNQVD